MPIPYASAEAWRAGLPNQWTNSYGQPPAANPLAPPGGGQPIQYIPQFQPVPPQQIPKPTAIPNYIPKSNFVPNYIPKSGFVPPNITVPTLGSLQQAVGSDLYGRLNQQVVAPTLGGIDTSSLPQAQGFAPQIQTWAQQQQDLGMKALERMFGQQSEQQREMSAQRGLVGSGVETEQYRRLYGQQQDQAQQMIGQIAGEAMRMQIEDAQRMQELQSSQALQVLGMNNQRDLTNIDSALKVAGMNLDTAGQMARMSADMALKKGDWQMAAEQSRVANAMDVMKLEQQERQFGATYRMDVEKLGQQERQFGADYRLKSRELLSKEEEARLNQMYREIDLIRMTSEDPTNLATQDLINKIYARYGFPIRFTQAPVGL